MAGPRLTAERRRALEMLAADRQGTSEALMLAHGLTRRMLTGLVRAGVAMQYRLPVRAGGRTVVVTHMMITAAGRCALGEG